MLSVTESRIVTDFIVGNHRGPVTKADIEKSDELSLRALSSEIRGKIVTMVSFCFYGDNAGNVGVG